MISRVAEHCFWLSRYLERSENTARILDVNQSLLLDFQVPVEQQWKPLLTISGIHNLEGPFDAERVQDYLTWDTENPSSIISSLSYARENARIIREVISAEMWERINYSYLWLKGARAKIAFDQNRTEFYNQVRRINQMIYGISEGTMSHGEPWDFFQLGRYLERACQTARILDVKYHQLLPTPEHIGTPIDSAHWVAILTSCSAYEQYLKHRTSTTPISVAEYLIYDVLFPRSVRFCLMRCQMSAHAISGHPIARPENDVELRLQQLLGWLQLIKINDAIEAGLHDTLTNVINSIHDLGRAIHGTYFDVQMDRYTSEIDCEKTAQPIT